jgi:magnesium transporter
MPETRFFHISQEGVLKRATSLRECMAAVKKGGYLWLDYFQPSKEDLSELIQPLGLHPLSIEDSLDNNQIPKIEDYPKHTFILFNGFIYENSTFTIVEVDLFIGDNFVVTVSGSNSDDRSLLSGIEKIIERDMENAKQGPAFLAHVLLDYVVDQKFIAIEGLEEEINHTEDIILADHESFNPGDLLHLRRDLLSLRKSLFHEREILVKICRKDCIYISEKAIFFYRDIYDHLAKFFELTESSRDIVTSLMEMYLSMINNQMARSANQTNAIVRRLTFITTIFMPLTLLAGIGGMSEWSMMTGPANWKIAYPAFLIGMLVLGVANYYFLKVLEKKRWEKTQKTKGIES